MPKQFLDILGIGKSLIRLSFERAIQIVPTENVLIATHANYKALVLEHLPELKENQVLLEPSRNNTAPCIAYTALKLFQKDPNALFAVLPSDHVIQKEILFAQKVNQAFEFSAAHDALITLGIAPSRPDTGYGYIEKGHQVKDEDNLFRVNRFTEKPDLKTAKNFINSGDYVWNAGIFIWSAKSVLDAFRRNEAQIINVLSEDLSCFNSDKEQAYINRVYPLTKSISVDFALMERSENVFTIPAEIGWSDLGTWGSLYNFLKDKELPNVVQAGDQIINNSQGNFIKTSNGKLVVIKGLDNFIIVDEEDVLLIYPREMEQEIKEIRNNLDKSYQ
jgi:mannose-1-phosphate guanylyltransferase